MDLILKRFDDVGFTRYSNLEKVCESSYEDEPYVYYASKDGLYELYKSLPDSPSRLTKEFWYEVVNGEKRIKRSERTGYGSDGSKIFINERNFNYSNGLHGFPEGLICEEEYCDYFIVDEKPVLFSRDITFYVPDGENIKTYLFHSGLRNYNSSMETGMQITIEELKKDTHKEY